MWFHLALCLPLLLLDPASSARIERQRHRGVTKGADPASLCANTSALDHACAALARSSAAGCGEGSTLTAVQLEKYFYSEASDIQAFFDELKIADSDVPCQTVCIKSLEYVQGQMGWALPPHHGQYAACKGGSSCKWVPLGDDRMADVATDMDLATSIKKEAPDKDPDDSKQPVYVHDAEEEPSPATPFRYAPSELAVRLAKIFNVFPQAPDQGALLEIDDPKFGPLVDTADYSTWKDIVVESEAWVQSALNKLPGSQNLVRAWFGRGDADTMRKVRVGLVGMVKTLNNILIKVGQPPTCSDESNVMAYVNVWTNHWTGAFVRAEKEGQGHVINFCKRYWKPSNFNLPSSKFGTVVHESSHHQGPSDESYMGAEHKVCAWQPGVLRRH